jgi:septal ring factor EnvC (AmiA/AmiB activator)
MDCVSQTLIKINLRDADSRHPQPVSNRPGLSTRAPIKRLTAAISAAFFMWTPVGKAETAKGKAPPAAPEIAEKQADLGELRSRIESLRKDLSASEENKADAGDRLRESERQISRLQRELHELGDQRGQLQKKLQNLEQQSKELSSTLQQQQSQLETLLLQAIPARHPGFAAAAAQRRRPQPDGARPALPVGHRPERAPN